MSVQLREVLSDFGLAPAACRKAPAQGAPEPPRIDVETEMDRRLAEAFARGEAQGEAAARAELKRELADQQAVLEQRLAEERQRWLAEQGEPLANALTVAVAELEAGIAGSVARVLDPFLKTAARDRMVDALAETLPKLLAGENGPVLTVRGPADLIDALKASLGNAELAIEFRSAEQPEVRVELGSTVIETAIAHWAARLDEVRE